MTEDLRSFLSGGLIVVGVLIATLCGLCTLYFGGVSLITMLQAGQGSYDYMSPAIFWFALVAGGIPTLLGIGLVWFGLRIGRPRPPPSSAPRP